MELTIKCIRHGKEPQRDLSEEGSWDFYTPDEITYLDMPILPGQTITIDTGVIVSIPDGYTLSIRPRHAPFKKGLYCVGGVEDGGADNAVLLFLHNTTTEILHLQPSAKIARLVLKEKGGKDE